MMKSNLPPGGSANDRLLKDVLQIVRAMQEEARQREVRGNIQSCGLALLGLIGGYLLNGLEISSFVDGEAVIDIGHYVFWGIVWLSIVTLVILVARVNHLGIDDDHSFEDTAEKLSVRLDQAADIIETRELSLGSFADLVEGALGRKSKDWENLVKAVVGKHLD